MVKKIEITITDAQYLALETIALDVNDFADNFITSRSIKSMENLRQTNPDAWSDALAAVIKEDGNSKDNEAIILKGFELGLFETAAEAQEKLDQQPSMTDELE